METTPLPPFPSGKLKADHVALRNALNFLMEVHQRKTIKDRHSIEGVTEYLGGNDRANPRDYILCTMDPVLIAKLRDIVVQYNGELEHRREELAEETREIENEEARREIEDMERPDDE